ncbi:MAG: class I SAM-dependent methyltransferase [Thermoanaerobaculia bacterium]
MPEREYAEGRWERLGGDREFPRLALVSALVDKFANGDGAVLDLGCGAGALARGVCNGTRRLYLGVDISSEVIRVARESAPPCAGFWVWDLEKGLPEGVKARAPFAVIVFSEILYELEEPLRVVRACEDLLHPDGVFVYSVWDPRGNKMLLRRLVAYGRLLFDVEVRTGSGRPWRVMVQNPRERDADLTIGHQKTSRLLRWLLGRRRCCG